jgi:hypothetical protein
MLIGFVAFIAPTVAVSYSILYAGRARRFSPTLSDLSRCNSRSCRVSPAVAAVWSLR